jgi:hypothetical protein
VPPRQGRPGLAHALLTEKDNRLAAPIGPPAVELFFHRRSANAVNRRIEEVREGVQVAEGRAFVCK